MNFAVPDGHVGDECLESREGSGVAERAPYPRIAEVVSGMVEFIAEASRVWNAHWRTLTRSGLVPLRSDFEPPAVPIGRASFRERGGQYLKYCVADVSLTK